MIVVVKTIKGDGTIAKLSERIMEGYYETNIINEVVTRLRKQYGNEIKLEKNFASGAIVMDYETFTFSVVSVNSDND